MQQFDIYKDISTRTNGDIYIGVVGAVRTGKSTFITKVMDNLVMPHIKNKNVLARMRDELPQSASGKVIMTTQPKFVPGEAVSIKISEHIEAKVRLVDCVGYMIEGATGHMEGDNPRMVKTAWSDKAIPFTEAAEIGTKKVIQEHSTIGIVMTSDGSIDTDLPRNAYVSAEERVVDELKKLGKPFLVILNTKFPASEQTIKLAKALSDKYGVCVHPVDVLNMTITDIEEIFAKLLYEFPLEKIEFKLDKWLQALDYKDEIISSLCKNLLDSSLSMTKMSDYELMNNVLNENSGFDSVQVDAVELGEGKITYNIIPKPDLFYKALSNACGVEINDDFELMRDMKEFTYAKKQYDKLSKALQSVEETGYGVVPPLMEEMTLNEPEIIKKGNKFGVKLSAKAPSLHIMKVDINAEVSPIVGTEQQSEEMMNDLLAKFETDPTGIWDMDMFGKSLSAMVNEGLSTKLYAMAEDTQKKMRKALSRIINEGKGGVICIIL